MQTDPKSSVDILEHVIGGIHVEQRERRREIQPVGAVHEPRRREEDEPRRARPPDRIDR